MRILLVDAYSSAHVGNAALLECSLEVLAEAFPGAVFTVLAKDPVSLSDYGRCLSYLFPDLLSPEKRSGWRAISWLLKNGTWAAVNALNLGVLRRLGLRISPLAYSFDSERRRAVRAMLEADVVVSIGGEMLNARFRRVTAFLLHGYWTAQRLGKLTVLFPQSVGPMGDGWFMRLSRRVLKGCDLIMPRDRFSTVEVERMGLSAERVRPAPDVAILQPQATREEAIELLKAEGCRLPADGPILGLTVCEDARTCFDTLRSLCEYVAVERGGQVVFLCANLPDDFEAAQELFASLSEETRSRSVLLSKLYRPSQFKAIANVFDVFVTARMHAAILATMSPVPTIALNTQPKIRGYMELIGQEDACLELAEVSAERLRSLFDRSLDNGEPLRRSLLDEREKLRPKVLAAGQAVRDIWEARTPCATGGTLFDTVVPGGYCVGCGACAHVPGSGIRMAMDDYGLIQAVKAADETPAYDPATVCPFSEVAPNEDALGAQCHGTRHEAIGLYKSLYAGYVTDADCRARGSSGGMATWVLTRLLESGEVDAVLHVRPREATAQDPRLFAYAVSRSVEEVREGAKSHYYPVELSEVLRSVAETPGRYALVGLPCFVKAARLLMRQEPVLAERITYCIALVCGHLKSTAYAECLAWQCGIAPGTLRRVDFRVKLPGRKAHDYGFEAEGETCAGAPSSGLLGSDWGLNFFSYRACDYCDDVFGETADLSIGDAWLRRYTRDGLGTNLIVVRSEGMERLIREGIDQKRIVLNTLTEDEVVRSQKGGLFNRREALAYRLHLAQTECRWHPPKRVRPKADGLSRREQRKHALRSLLAKKSRVAFRKAVNAGDFEVFRREMEPWVARYRAVALPFWRRRSFGETIGLMGAPSPQPSPPMGERGKTGHVGRRQK